MNLNEECLLQYLQEVPTPVKKGISQPLINELEALKPIFRKKQYVSFPMNILLKKIQTILS
jgi:hypothetical protein